MKLGRRLSLRALSRRALVAVFVLFSANDPKGENKFEDLYPVSNNGQALSQTLSGNWINVRDLYTFWGVGFLIFL